MTALTSYPPISKVRPMTLSEKLRAEARETSRLVIERSTTGLPGHVRAVYAETGVIAWSGHRDIAPPEVRLARDPQSLLSRPSSD